MKKTKRVLLFVLLAGISVATLAGLPAHSQGSPEEVWREFMAWFKTASWEANPTRDYFLKLRQEGVPAEEIERRAGIIKNLFFSRREAVEIYYDRAFTRQPTGDPSMDVPTSPSALLVEAVKGLKPGTALDAGMGQGRNAVYLAQRGWNVIGFDISSGALAAAESNAKKAGVAITAVKGSYDDFDFGAGKWDLIVLTFAWAPMSDSAFVERLATGLRKNGRIVFEHFLDTPERPRPAGIRALRPGQLRSIFSAFEIESYKEFEATADWGGPGSRLVRAIARKP
ncbi:MAG: methyltransferase domain-containing protein [Acidobacteriia bacterium]|nr:methyltransferase domain-containing protein [Terriglobia bacterium]